MKTISFFLAAFALNMVALGAWNAYRSSTQETVRHYRHYHQPRRMYAENLRITPLPQVE